MHLLTECKLHKPERDILIRKTAPFIDSHKPHSINDVLSLLLNSDDKFILHEFGKFLKIAFNKRYLERK